MTQKNRYKRTNYRHTATDIRRNQEAIQSYLRSVIGGDDLNYQRLSDMRVTAQSIMLAFLDERIVEWSGDSNILDKLGFEEHK